MVEWKWWQILKRSHKKKAKNETCIHTINHRLIWLVQLIRLHYYHQTKEWVWWRWILQKLNGPLLRRSANTLLKPRKEITLQLHQQTKIRRPGNRNKSNWNQTMGNLMSSIFIRSRLRSWKRRFKELTFLITFLSEDFKNLLFDLAIIYDGLMNLFQNINFYNPYQSLN